MLLKEMLQECFKFVKKQETSREEFKKEVRKYTKKNEGLLDRANRIRHEFSKYQGLTILELLTYYRLSNEQIEYIKNLLKSLDDIKYVEVNGKTFEED